MKNKTNLDKTAQFGSVSARFRLKPSVLLIAGSIALSSQTVMADSFTDALVGGKA